VTGNGRINPSAGNPARPKVTLTVVIAGFDNAGNQPSRDAGWEDNPVSFAAPSAFATSVTELPREDKEKLLRELARECGYLLQPTPKASDDFQRKLFLDGDE
jgi:hypothetical protein